MSTYGNRNNNFDKIDEMAYGIMAKIKLTLKYIFTFFLYFFVGAILFIIFLSLYNDALGKVFWDNDKIYKFFSLFESISFSTYNIIEVICASCTVIILFLIYILPKIIDVYVNRYRDGWYNVPTSGFTIPWLCLLPEVAVFCLGYILFSGRNITWYQILLFGAILGLASKPIITRLGRKSMKATMILQVAIFFLLALMMHFLIDQIVGLLFYIFSCLLILVILYFILDYFVGL